MKASPIDDNSDKAAHIGEYLILGFLLARALTHTQKNLSGFMIFWAAFLFCAFYGISDEIHQSLVPGRFSDWKDVLADTIGGFFGGWLYLFYFAPPQVGLRRIFSEAFSGVRLSGRRRITKG